MSMSKWQCAGMTQWRLKTACEFASLVRADRTPKLSAVYHAMNSIASVWTQSPLPGLSTPVPVFVVPPMRTQPDNAFEFYHGGEALVIALVVLPNRTKGTPAPLFVRKACRTHPDVKRESPSKWAPPRDPTPNPCMRRGRSLTAKFSEKLSADGVELGNVLVACNDYRFDGETETIYVVFMHVSAQLPAWLVQAKALPAGPPPLNTLLVPQAALPPPSVKVECSDLSLQPTSRKRKRESDDDSEELARARECKQPAVELLGSVEYYDISAFLPKLDPPVF